MNRTTRVVRSETVRGAGSRPGFAMFMALGALVIIAVLVAGSSYITLQESRLGQNQLIQSRAFAAAEYGLNKIQADWDQTPNLTMDNGETWSTNYTLGASGGDSCEVRMTRLNNETFWLVSTGVSPRGATLASRLAIKRVGAILRLRIPTIKANGAITTNGPLKVGGSTVIKGANQVPSGWGTQCTSAPDKAGVVVPPGTTPTVSSKVTGSPQWATDPFAADDNTYIRYGDETWETLELQAFPQNFTGGPLGSMLPSLTAGACNKADANNWGEPRRIGIAPDNFTDAQVFQECENYFPIVLVSCTPRPDEITHQPACSVTFNGGRGQGILLVDGDAKFNGAFSWFGLIIVGGDVTQGGGGAKITGALMARNADTETDTDGTTLVGGADFLYSSCALERAMRGSASVVQGRERSFTELY